MATTKLERLLDLVAELLHTERPLSAEELHQRIPGYPEERESFKRAFERDKAALRDMEIPLRIEPVPGTMPPLDGYRIDQEEYGLPDAGLDSDELAALQLAVQAVRLDGANARTGIDKLGGATGADVSGLGSVVIPTAPNLADVFEAVGHQRQLRFRYRDKDRIVDPFRLHHQRGHWYLQGHDHDVGESRSFRLDRIAGTVDVGDPGSAVTDVDPSEEPIRLDAWALGDDEPVAAMVRVRPPQAAYAARMVTADVSREWEEDGSVLLELPVRRVEGLRSFVIGFLDDAEILSPPELRDDFVRWLESMASVES